MKSKHVLTRFTSIEFFLFAIFFLFSLVLAWKTFRVSQGNMLIATKAWSDFGATIPLIRSFSFGDNFPPQYPIFAGPPIRYHFVFYFLVGMLEKIGLPISWALNIPSAVGFFALTLLIYLVAKHIFKSKAIAFLSVVFFLFNGSLSFVEFFKQNPLSPDTIKEIIKNTTFPSFGPYDGKIVSAFWNLNIYTNQRHLALAYSFFLFLLIYFYKKSEELHSSLNKTLILGLMVGLFPFIHYAVFGMLEVLVGLVFIFYPKLRKDAFIIGTLSVILAIPQIMYMGRGETLVEFFNPGYLVQNMEPLGFLKYWFFNLGLVSIFAPLGFFLSDKSQRKVFLPFLALFIIGNLFQFSSEIAANHKFFNLFVIGMNMFAAFSLVTLWKKKLWFKPIVIASTFLMILSGIIDIFPIMNDTYITVEDIPNNKAAKFIKENTPKESVFLNSSFLYHPASLAGRKIFAGWPYFAWSAGYDTNKRGQIVNGIYTSREKRITCQLLREQKIDYITVQDTRGDPNLPIVDLAYFSKNFDADYSDSNIRIISVSRNCQS